MARAKKQRGEDAPASLEAAADAINDADRAPDWEELAAVEREADRLRALGALDAAAKNALLDRARDAVPENRPEILRETSDAILRDR